MNMNKELNEKGDTEMTFQAELAHGNLIAG